MVDFKIETALRHSVTLTEQVGLINGTIHFNIKVGGVCIWCWGAGLKCMGKGLCLGVCVRRGVEQGIWTCRPM